MLVRFLLFIYSLHVYTRSVQCAIGGKCAAYNFEDIHIAGTPCVSKPLVRIVWSTWSTMKYHSMHSSDVLIYFAMRIFALGKRMTLMYLHSHWVENQLGLFGLRTFSTHQWNLAHKHTDDGNAKDLHNSAYRRRCQPSKQTAALQFTHSHCLYQNNHCTVLQTPMLPMRIMIADDGVSRMRMCVRLSVLCAVAGSHLLLLLLQTFFAHWCWIWMCVRDCFVVAAAVKIERLWNTGVSFAEDGCIAWIFIHSPTVCNELYNRQAHAHTGRVCCERYSIDTYTLGLWSSHYPLFLTRKNKHALTTNCVNVF